jgi:hypothetical protein
MHVLPSGLRSGRHQSDRGLLEALKDTVELDDLRRCEPVHGFDAEEFLKTRDVWRGERRLGCGR